MWHCLGNVANATRRNVDPTSTPTPNGCNGHHQDAEMYSWEMPKISSVHPNPTDIERLRVTPPEEMLGFTLEVNRPVRPELDAQMSKLCEVV